MTVDDPGGEAPSTEAAEPLAEPEAPDAEEVDGGEEEVDEPAPSAFFEPDEPPPPKKEAKPKEESEPEEEPAAEAEAKPTPTDEDAILETEVERTSNGKKVKRTVKEWIRRGQLADGAEQALQDRAAAVKERDEVKGQLDQVCDTYLNLFTRLGKRGAQGFIDEVSTWPGEWTELFDKAVVTRYQQLQRLHSKDPKDRALAQSEAAERRARTQLDAKQRAEEAAARKKAAEEKQAEEEKKANADKYQEEQRAYAGQMRGALDKALAPREDEQWSKAWTAFGEKVLAEATATNRKPDEARLAAIAQEVAKTQGLARQAPPPRQPPPPPVSPGATTRKRGGKKRRRKTIKEFFGDDFFEGDLPLPDDPFLR